MKLGGGSELTQDRVEIQKRSRRRLERHTGFGNCVHGVTVARKSIENHRKLGKVEVSGVGGNEFRLRHFSCICAEGVWKRSLYYSAVTAPVIAVKA